MTDTFLSSKTVTIAWFKSQEGYHCLTDFSRDQVETLIEHQRIEIDRFDAAIASRDLEIERLSRFADFLCRQDWTSRGRAIAEEAFMNAIAMDKEAGFPQPESRDG